MNDAELKTKKDEIYKMTSELKSHYFLDSYFVDPDKTFVKLLEKIIKFLEDDDFVINIKQNEHLYLNFKHKYESAVELIKNIETEKEKLSHALKKNKTNQEIFDNYIKDHKHTQNYVYFDDDLISSGSPNCTNNKSVKSFEDSPKETSQFQIKPQVDTKINAPSINISEFEKLKEDYFALYEEKKNLESQLHGHSDLASKLTSLREYSNRLQLQIDSLNEKLRISNEEKYIINERLSKITRENNDLLMKLHSAKESLIASDKEKNLYKNKISTNVNRVKMLEKEINVIKKKNQNLNFQVSNLMEKLNSEKERRLLLEKRNEENFELYEKKISTLEKDKQKIMKDSFTSLLEVINKQSYLDFYYRKETNKIDIYFENEKIGEFENKNKAETTFGDIYKQTPCRNSPLSNAIYFNNKEKSFGIDSPLRLQKLFSVNNISCSSNKKSSFNVTPNNDKENVNINFNSSRHNSQNKLNNIINLSSNKNKRYKTEFKLDIDEREEYDNPEVNKFNENKISSCINDININSNLSDLKNRFSKETRYYLTNTNNKNMISLEQVFGNGEEEISNINGDVNRKLSFTGNYLNTCSSNENVDIVPRFNYEMTNFDFMIEKESIYKKCDFYEIRRSVDFLQKGNLRETREESDMMMSNTEYDAIYAYRQNCIVENTNNYSINKKEEVETRVRGKCSNCMIF